MPRRNESLSLKGDATSVPLDFQSVTFGASLMAQLAVIAFSVYALAKSASGSETLATILTLETAVQGVEFGWYALIGVLFLRRHSPGVEYRYFDWLITTPLMLVSLLLFLLYLNEECLKRDAIVTKQANFWTLVGVSVAADWVMLASGLYFERRKHPEFLLAGTAALVVAFVPHVIVLSDHFSGTGLAVLLATLVMWALYGVVAFAFRAPTPAAEKTKNGCYNVLDIFSKNVAGVVVSYCALRAEC